MSLSIHTARANLESAQSRCRKAATQFGSSPWNEFDQAMLKFLPFIQAVRENRDELMRLLNEEAQAKAALAAEAKAVEQKETKGTKEGGYAEEAKAVAP